MPPPLTQQRSSASADFQHYATLQDMQEMNPFQPRYAIPNKEVPTPRQNAPWFPGTSKRSQTTTSVPHTTRSNSRASQQSAGEKFVVFRDEENPMQIREDCMSDQRRLDSDIRLWYASIDSGGAQGDVFTQTTNVVAQFAEQLQRITTERARLLGELGVLEEQEQEILSQLSSALPNQEPATPQRSHNTMTISRTHMDSTYRAPHFPIPNTRTPSMQPSKRSDASGTKAMLRPISAPPSSTPSALRHLTPSTSKRIPLSGKTKDLDLVCTLSSFYTASPILATPDITKLILANPHKLSVRGRSMRIPTNFGVRETDVEHCGLDPSSDDASDRLSRESSRGRSRGRAGSKNGRRSRSRPVEPTATPGMSRSYDVPDTVMQKQWEF